MSRKERYFNFYSNLPIDIKRLILKELYDGYDYNFYYNPPIMIKKLILKKLHDDDYDFSSFSDADIEEIFEKVVDFYV